MMKITNEEVELAINYLNTKIQNAAWESTPPMNSLGNTTHCPLNIKLKIVEKRKLRKK